MFRQFGERVDLSPGEDPLPVGDRVRQDSRAGPGGDQHHIGRVVGHRPVRTGHLDIVRGQPRVRVGEHRASFDESDPDVQQVGPDVGRLGQCQPGHPAIDNGDVHRDLLGINHHPQAARRQHRCPPTGGCDEGLGRHAVRQHAGAADPVPLDQRDVRAVLNRNERGLVAGGPAADDHDSGHRSTVVGHGEGRTGPLRSGYALLPWRCTRLTGPTWIPPTCFSGVRRRRWPAPAGCRAGG